MPASTQTHAPDGGVGSCATLVLGIGNVLWADEGFGVRCVEEMAQRYAMPGNVRLLDGGTQGLYLLPFLEAAEQLIIFDAIDFGLAPGTLHLLRDAQVPSFMGAKKMSLHQTGFQDVPATAQLLGQCPARLTLIGCQPVELEDYGGSLRPGVAAQILPALELARAELESWGIAIAPGVTPSDDLVDASLARAAYENGRPAAGHACRTGDERFFPAPEDL